MKESFKSGVKDRGEIDGESKGGDCDAQDEVNQERHRMRLTE